MTSNRHPDPGSKITALFALVGLMAVALVLVLIGMQVISIIDELMMQQTHGDGSRSTRRRGCLEEASLLGNTAVVVIAFADLAGVARLRFVEGLEATDSDHLVISWSAMSQSISG